MNYKGHLFNIFEWVFLKINDTYFLQNWRTGKILSLPAELGESISKTDSGVIPSNLLSSDITKLFYDVGIFIDKSQISSVNFSEKKILKSYEGPRLKRVLLHLTDKCNLSCKHCYLLTNANSSKKLVNQELDVDIVEKLIKEMSDMGALDLNISGGEPFLYENLDRIIDVSEENQVCIENIFTNGTLIIYNKEILKKLISKFWTTFYVSIDGLEKAHDQFRCSKGAFVSTFQGIEFLLSLGFKLAFNIALSKINLEDIMKLYDIAKNLKVKTFRVSSNFLLGRWVNNSIKYGVSIDSELKLYIEILNKWNDDGKPFGLELGHLVRLVPGAIVEKDYNLESTLCGYYSDALTIWPNGNVSFCPLLPNYQNIENLKNKSLKIIWESQLIRDYKQKKIKDIINEECEKCDLLRECGMGCRANAIHRGFRYEDKDPEICEIFKHPLYIKIREIENSIIAEEK